MINNNKHEKFYNSDRKSAFIEAYIEGNIGDIKTIDGKDSRSMRAKNFFHRSAYYEKQIGKDICEFNQSDSLLFVKRYFSNVSYRTMYTRVGIYRLYLKWCLLNGYLSQKEYDSNLIIKLKRSSKWDKLDIINIAIEQELEPDKTEEFIFSSEDDFFKYVNRLFLEDKFAMEAATICLMYYGFKKENIQLLLRSSVDKTNKSVDGIKILNETAFKLIYRAYKIDEYISYDSSGRKFTVAYENSKYLIRRKDRSFGYNDNKYDPVSITFFTRIRKYEDNAAELLPNNSIYKNIRISGKTILKLKFLYEVLEDNKKYGDEYVKNNFKSGTYDLSDKTTTMSYKDYIYAKKKINA